VAGRGAGEVMTALREARDTILRQTTNHYSEARIVNDIDERVKRVRDLLGASEESAITDELRGQLERLQEQQKKSADLDPEDCRELERFRRFLHARKRVRAHRAVLVKNRTQSEKDLFGSQLAASPYSDAPRGGVDSGRLQEDMRLIVTVALGEPA